MNLLIGFHIRDHFKHYLLGAFVIVSKPNGEYEFYQLPDSLLQQIVITESNGKKPW